MKRTVQERIKGNVIRGGASRSAPKATEVAAYPVSSYIPNNTWTVGDNDSKVGQLLTSLSDFSPTIQQVMGVLNEKRIERDKAEAATDAAMGKDPKKNPSAAYKIAYYQLKADADAVRHSGKWAALKERCDTTTSSQELDKFVSEELDTAIQGLIEEAITGDEDPTYLSRIVPHLMQMEADVRQTFHKAVLDAQDTEVKNHIATRIYHVTEEVAKQYETDPEAARNTIASELIPLLHGELDRSKALGYTTKDMQAHLIKTVGEEAVTHGVPELLDVFKEQYRGVSAYMNTTLKPVIDDYIEKATESRARLIKSKQDLRDQAEKEWQNQFFNTIYTAVYENYGNPVAMERIRKLIQDGALGNNEFGFSTSIEQTRSLHDLVNKAQAGGDAPLNSDPEAYFNALILANQTGDWALIMDQFGDRLNHSARIEILKDCLQRRTNLTSKQGQEYESFKAKIAGQLEQWWENTNPKTGVPHFADGIQRASEGLAEYYTRLRIKEQELKRQLTPHEIHTLGNEVRRDIDEKFNTLKRNRTAKQYPPAGTESLEQLPPSNIKPPTPGQASSSLVEKLLSLSKKNKEE